MMSTLMLLCILLCMIICYAFSASDVTSSSTTNGGDGGGNSKGEVIDPSGVEVIDGDVIEATSTAAGEEDDDDEDDEIDESDAKATGESLGAGEGLSEELDNVIGKIKDQMKKDYKAPESIGETFREFSSAINWKEPFIMYLLVALVSLLLFTVITREIIEIQVGIFFIICMCVFLSERLNKVLFDNCDAIGIANGKCIATQNYFDPKGTFAGIFWAGPLLFIGFFQLLNFLFTASRLLIKVKKMELKSKNKNASQDVAKNKDVASKAKSE